MDFNYLLRKYKARMVKASPVTVKISKVRMAKDSQMTVSLRNKVRVKETAKAKVRAKAICLAPCMI